LGKTDDRSILNEEHHFGATRASIDFGATRASIFDIGATRASTDFGATRASNDGITSVRLELALMTDFDRFSFDYKRQIVEYFDALCRAIID